MSAVVSVIIPVYNVEKYLERCVDSILKQSYQNIEIWLIDDGSKDLSGGLCDQYAGEDSRVHVIHKKNEGVSSARNVGLDCCTGDYISFIDSDDWIEPGMFEDMVSALEKTGSDFAVCNVKHIYDSENGIRMKEAYYWKDLNSIKVVDADGAYREIFACTATLWNKVFRRDILADLRFDSSVRYGEDCLMLLNIMKNIRSAVILPGHYYCYYKTRPGNVVSMKIDERSLDLLRSAEILYRELSARGYPDIGVHRICIAVGEVLGKIPTEYIDASTYQVYTEAGKKLVDLPTWGDAFTLFNSTRATHQEILSFMLMRTCFPFWMKAKK